MTDVKQFSTRDELIAFLADARRNQGVTQADVAEVVGTARHTIGDWERQVNEPLVTSLMAWAWALGFEVALVPVPRGEVCVVPGCGERRKSGSMCHPHYMRQWRTGDVRASVPVGKGWRGGTPLNRRKDAKP